MAKTKSTSKSKAVKTVIPEADRKAVTQYRGFMIAGGDFDAWAKLGNKESTDEAQVTP